MEEQLLKELQDKFGDIFELKTPASDDGRIPTMTVYCRQPTRQMFSRYGQTAAKDMLKAQQTMLMDCLVHPTAADITPTLEKFPGLLFVFGNELNKLLGLNLEAETKKL